MAVMYFTRVCEVLGAVGLIIPQIRICAAVVLIAFLIAILLANIHAVRAGVTLRGQAPTPLAIRIPMQITSTGCTDDKPFGASEFTTEALKRLGSGALRWACPMFTARRTQRASVRHTIALSTVVHARLSRNVPSSRFASCGVRHVN